MPVLPESSVHFLVEADVDDVRNGNEVACDNESSTNGEVHAVWQLLGDDPYVAAEVQDLVLNTNESEGELRYEVNLPPCEPSEV